MYILWATNLFATFVLKWVVIGSQHPPHINYGQVFYTTSLLTHSLYVYTHNFIDDDVPKRSYLSYLMTIIFYGYDYESICVLCFSHAVAAIRNPFRINSSSSSNVIVYIVLFIERATHCAPPTPAKTH